MLQRPTHTIGNDEVHVWHLLADRLTDPRLLKAVQALLSPEEQGRMACFRHERDRLLFLLSRGLMRTVLSSYLGCGRDEVRYSADAHGKPILQGNCERLRLHFNLSHSRGAAVLAVSGGGEVGIDIEDRQRVVEYLLMAERYFTADEARHLQRLPENQRREAFFAIWTLKEAFVKGIGRGLTFPLDAFGFDLDCDRLLRFRPLADFVSCDWRFSQFELGPRHRGALAVQSPKDCAVKIEMRDWQTAFVNAI